MGQRNITPSNPAGNIRPLFSKSTLSPVESHVLVSNGAESRLIERIAKAMKRSFQP